MREFFGWAQLALGFMMAQNANVNIADLSKGLHRLLELPKKISM